MRDFKLKVGPHSVDVNYLTTEEFDKLKHKLVNTPEDSFCYGAFIPPDTICILDSLKKSQAFTTLWHEIIELINVDYDLNLTHSQISTISEVIGQLLLKNKLRFEKIM